MCSSTRPTARPGSTAGWCPRRSWWPPACAPTAGGRCSASPSATARTARFGRRRPTGPDDDHDLRHRYAPVLLAQDESVIVVAERLGHENAKLVLSTHG